jgi:hypothetical protein
MLEVALRTVAARKTEIAIGADIRIAMFARFVGSGVGQKQDGNKNR